MMIVRCTLTGVELFLYDIGACQELSFSRSPLLNNILYNNVIMANCDADVRLLNSKIKLCFYSFYIYLYIFVSSCDKIFRF